ncbi:hypothetical protein [Streptomyces fulvoviolaceus]|uniref:hypothetical protein n=1 Tax=Streptomyces fulvoviolaceus TaxID=285535 RepID=UPI000A920006|nr:hypothetical protein [Streptomyces fulvoviolaceus]MCT9083079.1 hypothetical protein [Streptomyces fulvoviolaceus]
MSQDRDLRELLAAGSLGVLATPPKASSRWTDPAPRLTIHDYRQVMIADRPVLIELHVSQIYGDKIA